MTRDDYKSILDQALKAEHGIRLSFGEEHQAGLARAQFYRIREYLRRQEGRRDYDPLTFRLWNGDLCIIKRPDVPLVDDHVIWTDPVPMTKRDTLGLPTWPKIRKRVGGR